MELVKNNWTDSDIEEFEKFEQTLKGSIRDQEWEQRIVNTKLNCFGRTSAKAKEVAKQIAKGNFLEFLEKIKIKTHFDTLVSAFLINRIKDFSVYEAQVEKYIVQVDNWASVDSLKFDKHAKEDLKKLSENFLKSNKPFVRRLAVNFWFEIIKDKKYFPEVFEMLDSLESENEYYVNMSAAWLLAECMVKNRDETINYFENSKTNPFVINKAISKCRDSFRVSDEDKEFLIRFKIKIKNAK